MGTSFSREWWEGKGRASEKALGVGRGAWGSEDQASLVGQGGAMLTCHWGGVCRGHGGVREPAVFRELQMWAWMWLLRGVVMADLRLQAMPPWRNLAAEGYSCWSRRMTKPDWHLGSDSLSAVLFSFFPSGLPIFGRSSERHCQNSAIQGNKLRRESGMAHLKPQWRDGTRIYTYIFWFCLLILIQTKKGRKRENAGEERRGVFLIRWDLQ